MRTNAPHLVTWIIAVVLGALGILIKLAIIPSSIIPVSSFGLMTIAFLILAVATVVNGI